MDTLPQRKRLRLKYYDYSTQGLYFLTVCCRNHTCYFGSIAHDEMLLNDAGIMLKKWYMKIPEKFPSIAIHDFVIMPNHFHCVLEIMQSQTAIGHAGPTLPDVMQWFKTMTTNDYIKNVKTNNWQRFDKRLWQTSYYEHVIRTEQNHQMIVDYIKYNPQKWADDKYYKVSK